MIPVYVGFDPRESAVYHTFCQSVMDNTSVPVSFIPLHQNTLGIDGQQDGSNAFVYSRYLVPALAEYQGWAMFFDGDMVCRSDLSELWELRRADTALMVVKHDYSTRAERKYLGTPLESQNLDYPRKNWSSVMLINCAHAANRVLTRRFVDSVGGEFLHRFAWLHDDEIGDLPAEWNHLVGEYDYDPLAKIAHYTLGVPGFKHYMRCDYNDEWNQYLLNAIHLEGESAHEILRRSSWRGNEKLLTIK